MTHNEEIMDEMLFDTIGATGLFLLSVCLNFAIPNLNPETADSWMKLMLHSIQLLAGIGSLILIAHAMYLKFGKKQKTY